jgi:translation initiation factor 2B subunit (eIF-2B alpha/beta/delta family)
MRAEPTPIITAFVQRGGRILVVRRSGRVGTYRGKWCGISGYVERQPLSQAYLELREETGLTPDRLRLRGLGIPLPVPDPAIGRNWLVFPFLFAARPGAQVRLDWENAESRWIEPEALRSLDTVPGLLDAFARVWPPFGDAAFWRRVQAIATDKTHGATRLAQQALSALAAVARSRPKEAARAARALAATQPSMAALPHVMARAMQPGHGPARLERLSRRLDDATARSARQAARLLRGKKRVLTHSQSSACRQAIELWARRERSAEVIVTESRPANEGVELARMLGRAGVRVTLITDAQMAVAAQSCDAVIVGADAITEREVINKAGTRLAVCAAREAGVPAYAVTQTFKIAPPGWPISLARQDPEDVAATGGFRVANVVFDATPLRSFAAVITEEGPLRAARLREIRRELRGWGDP